MRHALVRLADAIDREWIDGDERLELPPGPRVAEDSPAPVLTAVLAAFVPGSVLDPAS